MANKSPQASKKQIDFATRVRIEAIDAVLRDDARLLRNLLTDVRSALRENGGDVLLQKNSLAPPPKDTLKWWQQTKGGLPDAFSFIERLVAAGEQPVFCSVSLYVRSSAPTIYVPVPYLNIISEGLDGFAKSVWLNAPDHQALSSSPTPDWFEIARQLSHAVSNISYSVRVGENPLLGWLSKAHAACAPIYLPDVSLISNDSDQGISHDNIITVAVEDERFLTMASVLYIPLVWGDRLPRFYIEGSKEGHAQAVLLLWSPIPHRWDLSGFGGLDSVEERIGSSLARTLCWLGDLIAKDEHDQRKMDAQLLTFLHALERFFRDGPSGVGTRLRGFLHGVDRLLEREVLSDPDRSTSIPVRLWAEKLLRNASGIIRQLQTEWRRDLGGVPLTVEVWRTSESSEASVTRQHSTISHAEAALRAVPDDATIPLHGNTALEIGIEVATNLKRYAQGLTGVCLVISSHYVTLRLIEEPEENARRDLLFGKDGFYRYFALRRGLAVPQAERSPMGPEESLGIGLALFSLVATRARAIRRLYLSPDGETCYVEVSLPCERRKHDTFGKEEDSSLRGHRAREG